MTDLTTECQPWTGTIGGNGYGKIKRKGKQLAAHRVAWEKVHGPIPDGLFVLHRCDNPPCVNVDHLFLGTQLDNMRDRLQKGRWKGNRNELKTHCPQGHEYTEENTWKWRGSRYCRECRRRRNLGGTMTNFTDNEDMQRGMASLRWMSRAQRRLATRSVLAAVLPEYRARVRAEALREADEAIFDAISHTDHSPDTLARVGRILRARADAEEGR